MTVEIKDILLKAAEDVQSGMWCKGSWFQTEVGHTIEMFPWRADLEQIDKVQRCAEGSIGVAVSLLGGNKNDWDDAVHAVNKRVPRCECLPVGGSNIPHFNDEHLPDDPFEAGQQLAELFRSTAESL